ncbi:MAG TPA: DUF2937 family protein [Stellaceae bacterium]|nr:DUF2937 family protein [Stellaceae bacterium]
MGLLGRWLSTSLALALGLGGAVLAMQVPAFTQHYLAGLQQAAGELDRSVADRLQSGRTTYDLVGSDRETVAGLATREPSNAATLSRDLDRRDSHAAILAAAQAASPITRPIATAWAITTGPEGWRSPVVATALATYDAGIALTGAAILWGLAGLVVGVLLAQLLALPFHRRPRMAVTIDRSRLL